MKLILTILCLLGYSFAANQLPSYIQVCKRKDNEVGKCVMKNIDLIRSKLGLKNGIREMGIPSLNPLLFPHAELKIGESFEAKLDNIKLNYIDEVIIENLIISFGDEIIIDLNATLPKIFAKFDHHVSGKLLILTLDGSGPGSIKLTDMKIKFLGVAKPEKKNGKDHVKIKSADIKTEIDQMDLNLENLFPQNPELTANANKVLNDNQNIIIDDISPVVVNIVKELLVSILNNVFDRYSMDVLFPND